MMLLPGDIKNIGVFRSLQLGDLLCAVPAFRALRRAYPSAHISLIGLPWAGSFVKRFNAYFDEFIHFPGAEGLPEQDHDGSALEIFSREMRERSFDLLIQMQGNGSIVNALLKQWEPRILAGFENSDSRMNSPFFMEYPGHGSEVLRHLKLMKHLGIPAAGIDLELPITENDRLEYSKLSIPSDEFVVVHPGSRGAWRQWPVSYFAECANYCFKQGYQVVVTGTLAERTITNELIKRIDGPVTDLTGKTSIGMVALVIRNASLLIANCTGVSHIAAAMKTHSIIISMDGEPGRWGPINKQLHETIDWIREPGFDRVFSKIQSVKKEGKGNLVSPHLSDV